MTSCPSEGRVGWIVGEATPTTSVVLVDNSNSKGVPPSVRVGSYVLVEAPEGCVLGIVESMEAGNRLVGDGAPSADAVNSLTLYTDIARDVYWRARVRWISLLDPLAADGRQVSPSIPPQPLAEVHLPPPLVLRRVFKGGRGWVRLGSIRSTNVDFYIDVNKLFRHLAILAVTGGGKSNTVCVLADRIVGELNGTMVIFDVHGEYAVAEGLARGKVAVKKAKINPVASSISEMLRLARVGEQAILQERLIRQAWKQVVEEYKKGKVERSKLFDRMTELIVSLGGKYGFEKKTIYGAIGKVEDLLERYASVVDVYFFTELEKVIEPGKLTIIDLSEVDDEAADAVVSHYLRRILEERKRYKRTRGREGYPTPVIAVIEEAHVLVPKDEETLTKYWASRVAREGRKFGVGLVLVSQRPKGLDPNVLSQTNNKIILRIVEPSDQRYVQAASEQLSEDLLSMLPSLNPGEAVVVGSMTRIPALVRIDLCPARTGGADIDAVGEWERAVGSKGEASQEALRELLANY